MTSNSYLQLHGNLAFNHVRSLKHRVTLSVVALCILWKRILASKRDHESGICYIQCVLTGLPRNFAEIQKSLSETDRVHHQDSNTKMLRCDCKHGTSETGDQGSGW